MVFDLTPLRLCLFVSVCVCLRICVCLRVRERVCARVLLSPRAALAVQCRPKGRTVTAASSAFPAPLVHHHHPRGHWSSS